MSQNEITVSHWQKTSYECRLTHQPIFEVEIEKSGVSSTLYLKLLEADENVCEHEWVDIRNKHVESGELCFKCNSVRATKIIPEETTGNQVCGWQTFWAEGNYREPVSHNQAAADRRLSLIDLSNLIKGNVK